MSLKNLAKSRKLRQINGLAAASARDNSERFLNAPEQFLKGFRMCVQESSDCRTARSATPSVPPGGWDPVRARVPAASQEDPHVGRVVRVHGTWHAAGVRAPARIAPRWLVVEPSCCVAAWRHAASPSSQWRPGRGCAGAQVRRCRRSQRHSAPRLPEARSAPARLKKRHRDGAASHADLGRPVGAVQCAGDPSSGQHHGHELRLRELVERGMMHFGTARTWPGLIGCLSKKATTRSSSRLFAPQRPSAISRKGDAGGARSHRGPIPHAFWPATL